MSPPSASDQRLLGQKTFVAALRLTPAGPGAVGQSVVLDEVLGYVWDAVRSVDVWAPGHAAAWKQDGGAEDVDVAVAADGWARRWTASLRYPLGLPTEEATTLQVGPGGHGDWRVAHPVMAATGYPDQRLRMASTAWYSTAPSSAPRTEVAINLAFRDSGGWMDRHAERLVGLCVGRTEQRIAAIYGLPDPAMSRHLRNFALREGAWRFPATYP